MTDPGRISGLASTWGPLSGHPAVEGHKEEAIYIVHGEKRITSQLELLQVYPG